MDGSFAGRYRQELLLQMKDARDRLLWTEPYLPANFGIACECEWRFLSSLPIGFQAAEFATAVRHPKSEILISLVPESDRANDRAFFESRIDGEGDSKLVRAFR